MKKKKQVFTSKDGVPYELTVIEDVIKLTDGQLELIEKTIQEKDSHEIENKTGIILRDLPTDQILKVTSLITKILSNYSSIQKILDDEIVDFTPHATERINDKQICIQRDWDYENVEHEVVECLKKSYNVEQIRLRFDPETKKSYKHFGFRIRGFKGQEFKRDAQIVVYFEEDPVEKNQTIMVITILEPDYVIKDKEQ